MSEIWRIAVRGEFAAAHALRNYRGKCERTHGHNFGVSVCVEGSCLSDDTGLLLDFSTLKTMLAQALKPIDHQLLNAIPPFDAINPSSENIARYIWEQMERELANASDPQAAMVSLVSVEVSEKPGQSATYMKCAVNAGAH